MIRRAGLAFAALLTAASGCAEREVLEISDGRVRAVIPGQENTAGYFAAHNPGAEPVVLTSAHSPGVPAIEMHATARDGDVMRMRRLEEVVIGPGDTVRFEPGGRHLMLFGAADLGDTVEIVLETRDGQQIVAQFETVAVTDR